MPLPESGICERRLKSMSWPDTPAQCRLFSAKSQTRRSSRVRWTRLSGKLGLEQRLSDRSRAHSGPLHQFVGPGCWKDNDDTHASPQICPFNCGPPDRILFCIGFLWRQQYQKVGLPERHFCTQLLGSRCHHQHDQCQPRWRLLFWR